MIGFHVQHISVNVLLILSSLMISCVDFLSYFDEQMLTSKDANFIGYTFKKSDLKSAGTAGILLC